jgi:FkbM family methyltransferase
VIKNLIRSAFRRVGIDVRKSVLEVSPELQLRAMLAEHDIDLVLDVGANTGQFAMELRQLGFAGRIVSFEPVTSAYKVLVANAAKDPLWEIAPRTAIGSSVGEISINVSGNSVSSSILPILETHTAAAPQSTYVDRETAPIVTLDVAAESYLSGDPRIFTKIDTQGYEAEVLKGGQGVLSRSVGIQLELSLVPLYQGQILIHDLWGLMRQAGFELWAMTPVFVDPQSGRLLQVDATFFRKSASSAVGRS